MGLSVFAAAALDVPIWTAIPFLALLLCIAVLPIVAGTWWHRNANKAKLAALFALPVAIFLGQAANGPAKLGHAVQEFVEFIVMLGALYSIAGGVALSGDLKAKPIINAAFLALGAVLANVIGTTGASMLLIRPILRTNSERKKTAHIPVFFIFIVSNTGGLLTPLGDPPLFLGFLRGVDFFWTLTLWRQWLLINCLLVLVFLILDTIQYRREKAGDIQRDDVRTHPLRIDGWAFNGALMLGVIGLILAKKYLIFPLPELGMLALATLSVWKTPRSIRTANHFTWFPIIEVAILFAAIFICMVPALALLEKHGAMLGIVHPWQYFWLTGMLSSALDNAPTYVTLGTLAQQTATADSFAHLVQLRPDLLAAVSCGAVLMGANTYIGNGPNFMVKAIAEDSGYPMPSFFGYVGYAIAFLIPLFVIVTFAFFW
jgi:Na+/H+ antiporter NhaD/arsenite permease-like protein